jgi:hypothetical protein
MAVDPNTVDLTHIEDVTDITPKPTVAERNGDRLIGPIGGTNKRILLDLLNRTDEDAPFDVRVFDRLGVDYTHATWDDYDLYWVKDADAFTDALRTWHSAQEMG